MSAFSAQVVEESASSTPLIFVLSPGVDPMAALQQLAEDSGMSKHFHALSLGQEQAHIAKSMVEEGVKNGKTPLHFLLHLKNHCDFFFSRQIFYL